MSLFSSKSGCDTICKTPLDISWIWCIYICRRNF